MVYHHKISIIIIKSRSKLLIIRGWQHRGRSLRSMTVLLSHETVEWIQLVLDLVRRRSFFSGGGSLALQTLDQNGISTWHLLYTWIYWRCINKSIYLSIYRVGQETGPQTMTIILSILNRFKKLFSLEDSFVNLQLNGCQKSHRTLHMLLHYLVKH